MPVRHRELGDDLAAPEPKRCRHCDESRSPCGGDGDSEGSARRESWRVTLDHDLVETLSAIYPEWFKPQHRRERGTASPVSLPSPLRTPNSPDTSPSEDTFSSGTEDMASRQPGSSNASDMPSSPRVSPPKVVVDDSPLQPAMGKHKESLKVKLMMRRPINQLVAQGIMAPLKTPAAYFEQCKQLERAKTGDLLKMKIQQRPDRQELERRHILEQESHVDPSLAEKQRMLKKARLADQLNDQLSHRPGPLELIKKNILHTEEDIETAVKSGTLAFKATCEGSSHRPEHPSSYCGPPEDFSPSPSPPSTISSAASPPQHPAPGKDKNRKKSKQKQQPKARFKFHEYKGPPSAQKASTPPGSVETPYELLLQQQQMLLQLTLPASPAASIASDSSEHVPPPPPLPPAPSYTYFEDMKVSDLRAECKRRNLRVSGPKPQLIDRLRPYLIEKQEDPPRSPSVASLPSVASIPSVASPEHSEPEDIVQSQRRQIEELERKLEASRRQLEAVRRDAAGAAASDQSRRLLQAHVCVMQLRAKLDALQQPAPAPPPVQPSPSRYVLTAEEKPPTPRYVITTETERPTTPRYVIAAEAPVKQPQSVHYILNGVKVVPIAILPSPHYQAPPPPPPPPPLPIPTLSETTTEDSQIMDDVLEILVENGELPPSAVQDSNNYTEPFSPSQVLSPDVMASPSDQLQRELDDIQNEIMNQADMQSQDTCIDANSGMDPDLGVDLLSVSNVFSTDASTDDHDDFFGRLLADSAPDTDDHPQAMDLGDDVTQPITPLSSTDILDHTRPDFDQMEDLSLPSFQEDRMEERPCDFDPRDFGIDLDTNMNVDNETYDYMPDMFPNMFERGHVPRCDPLLGAVLSRPPPRPAHKHYSWDKIEFDAT